MSELDDAVDAAIAQGRRDGTARDIVIETICGPVDAVEFDLLPVLERAESNAVANTQDRTKPRARRACR